MGKMTFNKVGSRTRAIQSVSGTSDRTALDIARDLKGNDKKNGPNDYRERSLAIHGLICAHCGREFTQKNRNLLTVHHKDGNHHNNPPDGSNWENLCIYCHENEHSRETLGEYFDGEGSRETAVTYRGETGVKGNNSGLGTLGAKIEEALKRKSQKP